jgi:hypothetical protein
VRVGVAGTVLEGEEERQRAAHQRFRLAEPVGVLQQRGEVVELDHDPWMVLAVAGLLNVQPATHQRFRLLNHQVYDCFCLARAEDRAAVLVTADRRLLGWLAGTEWEGLAVGLQSVATG